ncbi:MAG: hypothetical protein GY856_43520 [bacterium]|nr:hypothetical protein [bacterium]
MIEFVTLFLGLVHGLQSVEVSVGPNVASVEIQLDGQTLGTLRGEPWILKCDFGEELAPHELVAIARDDKDQEVERARQLINLPRARAEARFALEGGKDRGPPSARLIYQALDFDRPEEVNISFDGRELEWTDLEHIELPRHDPESIHFLYADVLFSNNVATHAELAFGGFFGDEVASELTAVMAVPERGRVPKPEKMEGWFLSHDRPLRVVAVEQEPPIDLLIIREQSKATKRGLENLIRARGRMRYLERREEEYVRFTRRDRARFVFTSAQRRDKTDADVDILPVSLDMSPYSDSSLFHLLTGVFFPEEEVPVPQQRLADAVAVAGLVAAAGNHRRAVVLVYSGDMTEVSQLKPEAVSAYLRKLRVPLFVWAVSSSKKVPLPTAWGNEEDISTIAGYRVACTRLRKVLDSQVAIWVEGGHLSAGVELSDQAKQLSLLE